VTTYCCPPPDLAETRRGRTLHVWGDAAYWLVADAELSAALAELARPQDLPALAEALAARFGRPARRLRRELAAALSPLYQAGVVRRNGLAARRPDPASPRLEVVCVNLTNRCNLRCVHCFSNASRTAGRSDLSAEEVLGLLRAMRPDLARRPLLALMGGEPLLARDRLLAVARGAGRRWEKLVSTNGLLIDDAFARAARAAGLQAQVSVDGARRASHEALRGPGTFEAALAGVRRLVAAGAHTVLSLVAHRGNQGEVAAYLDLALALGASEARVIPLKRVGGGGTAGLEAPDLAGLVRDTARALGGRPERRRLLGRDYLSLLARTVSRSYRRTTCGTASQTVLVDADGTLYPCQNHCTAALAAGNVRDRPWRDLWRGEVFARLRETGHVDRRPACAACPVRYWCMGGCRGEAYHVAGRFDAPSATCRGNREAILETCWALAARPDLAGDRPGHF